MLSLDPIKEALADVLGLGGEDWSNQVGDAAAEVVFRLAAAFPDAVARAGGAGRAGTGRWASSPARPRCSATATPGWLRTGPRPGSATDGIPFTVT